MYGLIQERALVYCTYKCNALEAAWCIKCNLQTVEEWNEKERKRILPYASPAWWTQRVYEWNASLTKKQPLSAVIIHGRYCIIAAYNKVFSASFLLKYIRTHKEINKTHTFEEGHVRNFIRLQFRQQVILSVSVQLFKTINNYSRRKSVVQLWSGLLRAT